MENQLEENLVSIIDTPALNNEYESSLDQVDATDTLVAIAKVSWLSQGLILFSYSNLILK